MLCIPKQRVHGMLLRVLQRSVALLGFGIPWKHCVALEIRSDTCDKFSVTPHRIRVPVRSCATGLLADVQVTARLASGGQPSQVKCMT